MGTIYNVVSALLILSILIVTVTTAEDMFISPIIQIRTVRFKSWGNLSEVREQGSPSLIHSLSTHSFNTYWSDCTARLWADDRELIHMWKSQWQPQVCFQESAYLKLKEAHDREELQKISDDMTFIFMNLGQEHKTAHSSVWQSVCQQAKKKSVLEQSNCTCYLWKHQRFFSKNELLEK